MKSFSVKKNYRNISKEFVLIISSTILIALLANALYQYTKEKELAFRQLDAKSDSIARLISTMSVAPLLVYDNLTLYEYAEDATKQDDVAFAVFYDSSKNIITGHINEKYTNKDSLLISLDEKQGITSGIKNVLSSIDTAIKEYPIVFQGKEIATIVLGVNTEKYQAFPLDNLLQQIYISMLLGVIIGTAIYFGLQQSIVIPLKKLTRAARKVANFEFDTKTNIASKNEIAELADSFNEMQTNLKNAVSEKEDTLNKLENLNNNLEERVKERTLELQRLNAEISHQALHDPLTGLPNRVLILERINQAIESAKRYNNKFAILIIDLNNFKIINDTLGHPEGDRILKQVAERLPNPLRNSDTIGRLGGDEFAVVLPGTNEKDALQVAEKLFETLHPHFYLDDQNLSISGSIGIAIYPEHGSNHSELIRHADVAMYESKNSNTSINIYNPSFDKNTPKQLSLVNDLKDAIANNELELYYQPQVDLRTLSVTSVEALLRWNHKKHGYIPPCQCIQIAEKSSLINKLTRWVLQETAKQLHLWKAQGFNIKVAVNLSPNNLNDNTFVDYLHELHNQYRIPFNALKLEITENAIMTNPETAMNLTKEESISDIRFSIDDFGTGYSSLSYLKKLNVSEVKIDKSFVMEMDVDEKDASIVRSIIELAHNLNLSVIAEGVETEIILQQLRKMGCDYVQGFLYSKAVPPDELQNTIKYIETHNFIIDHESKSASTTRTLN